MLFAITGSGCSGPAQPSHGAGAESGPDRTAEVAADPRENPRNQTDGSGRRSDGPAGRSGETARAGSGAASPDDEADLVPLPESLRRPLRRLEREVGRALNAGDGDERIARVRPLTAEEKAALEPEFRQPGPITMNHLVAIDVRFRRVDGSDGFGRLVVAEHFSHRALSGQRSPRRDYWKKLDQAGDRRPIARELAGFFQANYRAEKPYPIDRMVPLHYFRELAEDRAIDIDELSMRHNNTYAFAIRKVRGTSSWSRHAIGAVDINPLYNPIISRTRDGKQHGVDMRDPRPEALSVGHIRVEPLGSTPYAFARKSLDDRRVIRGRNAAIVRYLVPRGWMWGGQWRSMKDYHHFAPDRRRR